MSQWPPLVCAMAFLGISSIQAAASDDFLFIIAEDQSAARYGTNVRPNPTASLEGLGALGTVFQQAYAPASVCNPSRTSILVCQSPDMTGIYNNVENSSEIPTVLHYLADQGYLLRAVGKIFHNGNEQNEVFTAVTDRRGKGGIDVEFRKRGFGTQLQIGVNRTPAMLDTEALRADKAIRWIKDADPLEKNGILVGFTATHLPFFVPDTRRYVRPYELRRIRRVPGSGLRPEFAGSLNRKYGISHRRKRQVVGRYYGCLRYVSDRASQVIRAFRRKFPDGHAVFVSDHGFMLGEGAMWGKSDTMEASCRVPYFVWSNQLPRGSVTGPVSTGTAFPLLLDLCGVPAFPGSGYQSPRAAILAGEMPPGSMVVTYAKRSTWYRITEGNTVTHYKDGEIFITGLDDQPLP